MLGTIRELGFSGPGELLMALFVCLGVLAIIYFLFLHTLVEIASEANLNSADDSAGPHAGRSPVDAHPQGRP